jgi:hypothetical protein
MAEVAVMPEAAAMLVSAVVRREAFRAEAGVIPGAMPRADIPADRHTEAHADIRPEATPLEVATPLPATDEAIADITVEAVSTSV